MQEVRGRQRRGGRSNERRERRINGHYNNRSYDADYMCESYGNIVRPETMPGTRPSPSFLLPPSLPSYPFILTISSQSLPHIFS